MHHAACVGQHQYPAELERARLMLSGEKVRNHAANDEAVCAQDQRTCWSTVSRHVDARVQTV